MKFKVLLTAGCCALLLVLSTVTAFAAPEDSDYLDDIYNWVSSTVIDIADDYNGDNSSDNNDDTPSDDTSSDNTSHEDETGYYEETEPNYEETVPTEDYASSDTSSNWYDWFSVSQVETEPQAETLPQLDNTSSSAGTTEYVGYGLFMWAVIIVGVLLTLGILTNTHIRKKS